MTCPSAKSADEENDYSHCKVFDKRPEKRRELFGVQLEVINLLLEAERRKLCVLQRELKIALQRGGSIKSKEHQKQELILAIQRIQIQYDNLEKECRIHAIGALKANNFGKEVREAEPLISNIWGHGNGDPPSGGDPNGTPPDLPLPELPVLPPVIVAAPAPGPTQPQEKEKEPPRKQKPPVPPKRSTLTYGKVSSSASSSSIALASPSVQEEDPACQLPTSHLITVKTNILSPAVKSLPAPRPKGQRVLSTFLPALPPKASKSPLVQSPNFPRAQLNDSKPETTPDTPDTASESSAAEDVPKTEESPPFSPSNSQPPLPQPPPKPARKTPPLKTEPTSTEIKVSPPPVVERGPLPDLSEEAQLFGDSENTNTIKRAPQKKRLGIKDGSYRTKSPIRVSFADEKDDAAKRDTISRTKRATNELKSIIQHIEYAESDYCSDADCRTCTVQRIRNVSTRRALSPPNQTVKTYDTVEGYASCCEEGTKLVTKKTKKRLAEKRAQEEAYGVLCNCPLDTFVLNNRKPISRPNSSIGDYCSRPKSVPQKSAGAPLWNGPSKSTYETPGLGLVVTISSDGINQEPKRTVHFISGGPAVNFGLGGTLGRYTKSKSQDKSLKIAGSGFSSDRSSSDFESVSDRPKPPTSRPPSERPTNLPPGKPPLLEKQKSAGDIKTDFRQRHFSATLNRKKSPGEVLEHFGKLATSVTSADISKSIAVKDQVQNFEQIGDGALPPKNAYENFRTVPPASFNTPAAAFGGSAFVQYIRETLPAQPTYQPNPFDKYLRQGSGRFDKSLILPQQPKSDKPSAFERLCGDKIYSSRRGIYGKKSDSGGVSGSLDCVWGQPVGEREKNEAQAQDDSRPASCTYEVQQQLPHPRGGHPNYTYITPIGAETEKPCIGPPRTSKKGIIEQPEAGTVRPNLARAGTPSITPAAAKPGTTQFFNPRSLDQYRLAPGCKTDLSTLYSGVFYAKPSESPREGAKLLNEYGIRLDMGSTQSRGDETGNRKVGALTGGIASIAAAQRIPEEPGPGAMATLPPQYHPLDEDFVPSDGKSNRSQPAIGLKQTPKTRPTIFGTVASDQIPKDGSSRRSLPQTAHGVTNGSGENSSLDSVQESTPERDIALVYRDGNLVSGSLDALIQHMVPTAEYYPDRAYLFAFLLSSRLFIKPHELLGQVCALCDSQQHLGGKDPPPKERLGHFIPHFVQLLAEWTETFPYDFRDERVMVHVRSITQKFVTVEPGIRKEVSTLLQNLLLRLTTLEKYEEFLQRVTAEATVDSLEALSPNDVTELCSSPGLLAQQLTHIELERLSYIGPEEFVQAFAKENPNLETSFKDMKKTRNLESYVSWFNRLSYLVATEVCKHQKKKLRVRVVEYWIETARECFNIGNFNSLMAIIAGLNMSPVARLKKTWSKIQSGKFSILEHQMDPSSNFSSYRSTLKAAMWRSAGATDQRQRIVIPFFSLLVKDLYFLNEGCSSRLPNGHINFEKFWQLAKQVTEFITWKQVTCPFDKVTRVITFLQASAVLTENALALASFECEQPENNHEKERYKSLK